MMLGRELAEEALHRNQRPAVTGEPLVAFKNYGKRRYLTLGTDAEGWDRSRAEEELQNVLADVRRGTWRPHEPELHLEPAPEPTFHEFATLWLDEKEADLERNTYADYLNLLTNHLLPAFHDRRLSQIDYEAIRSYRTARLREDARRRRANDAGAPLRLVVPWKYGFKSIKSIVRIRLTETQPQNTWAVTTPHEYGFYANVNPNVHHPRWSQARERRIGEFRRRPTLMFNGYADEVGHLYEGMDLRRYF
jgi:hypothetical protein